MLRRLHVALLLCGALFCGVSRGQGAVGEPAPRLAAARWFNHIGETPSVASLRGRTVLVNVFVTKEPVKAQFRILRKLHEEYADKGLVIVALTPDSAGDVERLLAEWDLPFVIGAGSSARGDWGVKGDYAQALIEPGGTVFWRAPAAAAIWDGKLLKALRGAERLGTRAALRVTPAEEYEGRLGKLVEKLRAGELAKALKELERIESNERTPEVERSGSRALMHLATDHADAVVEQCAAEIERREVLPARAALQLIVKELRGRSASGRAAELLARLADEEPLAREVEAAEEYGRVTQLYWRIGPSKSAPRFEKIVERWPDSRAAEKARSVLLLR